MEMLLRYFLIFIILITGSLNAYTQCAHDVSIIVIADPSGGNSGTMIAQVTPVNGPPQYLWSNGATTQVNPSLSTGYYCLSVTGADGCVEVACDSIVNAACVNINLNITNATSQSATDGSITANVSGGTGGYAYSWNTGATTATINNLAVGYYCVTVLDLVDSCFNVLCDSVASNSTPCNLSTILSVTNANSGQSNGSISATPSGAQSPYTYIWSNGATTQTVNNLAGGVNYCVTVTSADSCTDIVCDSVLIIPCNLSGALTVIDETNNQANGSISTIISNGSGQYTYTWSNGQTTSSVSNLSAGNYCVTILDNVDSCSIVLCDTVNNIGGCNLGIALSVIDETGGLGNGSISSTISGGSGQYTYTWNNGSTTSSISNLSAGFYCLTVLDITDSCTATLCDSVTNVSPCNLGISLSVTDETGGLGNGSISSSISGGSGQYAYSWNTGGTNSAISSLNAGYYCLTVLDITDSCTAVACDSVDNIGPCNLGMNLSVTDATSGLNNGSITASVSNGSGNYAYIWNVGNTTQSINNLSAGYYCVTVLDLSDSCTINACDSVVNLVGCNITANIWTLNATGTNSNGTIGAIAAQGTNPYNYVWNTGATTPTLTNQPKGYYCVTVTDAAGCTYQGCDSLRSTNDSCFTLTADAGGNNNDVIVSNGSTLIGGNPTAIGGAPPYTYQWFPSLGLNNSNSPNPQLANTNSQIYQVIVTNANGCSYIDSVEVRFNPLSIDAKKYINGNLVQIFPNPAEHFVNVQFEKSIEIMSFELISLQGQSLLRSNVFSKIDNYQLDLSAQAKGIYFLIIQSEDQMIRAPIIIR
jgi:hypothetical protein